MRLALSRTFGQVGYAIRVDDLDAALTKVADTREAARTALSELYAVIRQMIARGERGTQAEIVRRTGYTRERIRQIVREEEG